MNQKDDKQVNCSIFKEFFLYDSSRKLKKSKETLQIINSDSKVTSLALPVGVVKRTCKEPIKDIDLGFHESPNLVETSKSDSEKNINFKDLLIKVVYLLAIFLLSYLILGPFIFLAPHTQIDEDKLIP